MLKKFPTRTPLATAVAALTGMSFALAAEIAGANEKKSAALEEVVVTAQKKVEGYLDVPVAVSAFSGEVLDLAKATEFQDLVQVSPSVTHNQTGGMRGNGVLIRGIGTTAFQTGVEPTVSTVVDGVTMGRTAQFLSDLADIERVEILRGPQGTLFGKNASAGLIHIITKRPSEEFEGKVKVSATDDDGWAVNGSVSGPLSDVLRYRVSGYTNEYDGFIKNKYTGETVNGDESSGIRAKLEWDITESANLLLIADYSKQDRNCCQQTPAVLGNRFSQFDNAGINVGKENDEYVGNGGVTSNTETSGISAELNMEFEGFNFTSITAYRGFEFTSRQPDADMFPYSGPTYGRFIITKNDTDGGGNQEQKQFSQEFRIDTSFSDNVDFTMGAFYWNQEIDRYFEREVYFCTSPSAGDLSLSPDPAITACDAHIYGFGYMDSLTESENWAVFGQTTWRFAEDWSASFGLRYTEDELKFDFRRTTLSPGPAVAPSFATSNSLKEDDISGKVSLQWDMSDDTMVFLSYAEGYKAPTFDIIFGLNSVERTKPVPAEKSEAWEMGVKSELFDNRLRLGATVFHTKFDGLQGQAFDANAIAFQLTSAGTAITKGLELDFTAKPMPNLLINGGVALVDAYFDEFLATQCYPGQTEALGCIDGFQDLSGADIPNSPDLKIAFQVRYDVELSAPYDLFVSANYRYQDESPGAENQDPRLEHEAYDITDLVVGLDSDDGRWTAQFWVKNLFDEAYEDRRVANTLTGGVDHFLARDFQRYMGVDFEYRFGSY